MIVAAVAVIAFALRLAVSFELAGVNAGINPVLAPAPGTDMFTYGELAGAILEGRYVGEFYYQPFYYAIFLVTVKYLFGSGAIGLIFVQSLLGALCVYLTALCAAMIRGRRCAVIAALLCGLSNTLVAYTPFQLIATLMAFWLVLILYLALRARKRQRIFLWMLCGLACGAAILTRGNIWLVVPGIMLLAFRSGWRQTEKLRPWKHRLGSLMPLAAFLFMLILPQLPFAWHNSMVRGHLCGPSTAAGAVLALGNTPEAPPGGRNPGTMAGPMEYPPSYQIWMSRHSVFRQIWQWFYREPGAFCELMWRKALLFWDYRSIPNNISVLLETQRSFMLKNCAVVADGAIIALALAGIFLIMLLEKLRKEKMLLLLYMLGAYWLAVIIFYNLARFRAPALPVMTILAGIYIDYAFRAWLKNKKRFYCCCAPVLIAGVFISFSAYDQYRNIEAMIMRAVRPDGVQVRTAHGGFMLLDNGPRTFGNWQPLKLESGLSIMKIFPGEDLFPLPYSALELELCPGYNPGRLRLSVNGEIYEYSTRDIAKGAVIMQIPENYNRCVQIKVLKTTGDFYVFLDHQRNYHRTSVDGEAVSAELVCRMYREFDPSRI